MSNNSNLAIGASVGALGGGIAGYKIGAKKAAENVEALKNNYVNARVNANFDNVIDSYKGHSSKIYKAIQKVTKSAKESFETNEAGKLVKNTKVKWIAALGLAGVAVGTGIAAVVNKVKADKAEDKTA